jgi:hypothetical protein
VDINNKDHLVCEGKIVLSGDKNSRTIEFTETFPQEGQGSHKVKARTGKFHMTGDFTFTVKEESMGVPISEISSHYCK